MNIQINNYMELALSQDGIQYLLLFIIVVLVALGTIVKVSKYHDKS